MKFSDFKKPNINFHEPNLIISTPLFNSNCILPIIFIIGAIRLIDKSNIYVVLAVFTIIFALYMIWDIYNAINIIRIDMQEKCFILSSRKFLKALFTRSRKINFNEINKFRIKEDYGFTRIANRFIIIAEGNDQWEIAFTQSLNDKTAFHISSFLNRVLNFGKMP